MDKTIPIPGTDKTIGGKDVLVVAEIGKGFIQSEEEQSLEVYLENAKRLVDTAVESGADAVKFQTHEVEDEVLPLRFTSPHFSGSDRFAWVRRNTRATPFEYFWLPLKRHCDKRGIIFFSTPMSRKAAEKLAPLDVPLWKVGSGDVRDYVLLETLSETGKPVIISSGMVSLAELDEVVGYLRARNVPTILLYCVSQYPASPEHFNLATLEHFKERYPDVVVGFSDHSIGYDVALSAVKLGARIVEKHFSLSRELWGSDHKVSMTPREMKNMTLAIRNGGYRGIDHSSYYGQKNMELEGANNIFRPYFHKSLVAGRDIPAGKVLEREMIYAMRPRMHIDGLPSEAFHEAVGRRTVKSLKKYEPLKWEFLEV